MASERAVWQQRFLARIGGLSQQLHVVSNTVPSESGAENSRPPPADHGKGHSGEGHDWQAAGRLEHFTLEMSLRETRRFPPGGAITKKRPPGGNSAALVTAPASRCSCSWSYCPERHYERTQQIGADAHDLNGECHNKGKDLATNLPHSPNIDVQDTFVTVTITEGKTNHNQNTIEIHEKKRLIKTRPESVQRATAKP